MSTQKEEYLQSYASLLTSPTTVISLDRQPLPWFSSEVRRGDDPRVQWLDLSELHEDSSTLGEGQKTEDKLPESSRSSVTQMSDSRSEGERSEGERSEGERSAEGPRDHKSEEEAVAGHYLDHIETVQQRDKGQNKTKSRRSRKRPKQSKGSQRGSSPPAKETIKQESHSSSQNTPTSTSSTSDTPQDSRGHGKSKRRRGRRNKPDTNQS